MILLEPLNCVIQKELKKFGKMLPKIFIKIFIKDCIAWDVEDFYKEEDLIDGLCPVHKTKPEIVQEENYFF